MSAASFEKSRLELVGTLQGHSNHVYSVSFSTDGTKVASGSADVKVKLWGVTSGECLQTLEGHSSWMMSVSFSPDGTRLTCVYENGYSMTWDISGCTFTQEALPKPEGGPDIIMASATHDVNTYVGFGRLQLRVRNDCAVCAEDHKVHFFKLMR